MQPQMLSLCDSGERNAPPVAGRGAGQRRGLRSRHGRADGAGRLEAGDQRSQHHRDLVDLPIEPFDLGVLLGEACVEFRVLLLEVTV